MSPLVAAILALWQLPNGHYVRSCGPDCELRAEALEHAAEEAGIVHNVPPRVLLAVGWVESSLLGRDNETSTGVWGFHRKSKLWRGVATACGVSGPGHVARANRKEGLRATPNLVRCLDAQADVAAGELARLTQACGSLQGALSAYQSGRCESETGKRYARRVMAVTGRIGGV